MAISTPWKNVMTDGIKVGKYMMREIKLRTVKQRLDGLQSNSQQSLMSAYTFFYHMNQIHSF